MLGKLQDMQRKMEESQKTLDNITVSAEAGDGAVTVECTAARKVTNISLNPQLIDLTDTEQLEDLLLTAINRALQAAEQRANAEMGKVTEGILPPNFDMGNLF